MGLGWWNTSPTRINMGDTGALGLAGWHEVTIVVRFWIVAGIGVAVGLGLGLFYSDFLAVTG